MNQNDKLEDFQEQMKQRLEMGVQIYGNGIFNDDDLIVDIEEELLDLANYSYLIYARIQNIKQMIPESIKGKLSNQPWKKNG